jgi:hypothetical protein
MVPLSSGPGGETSDLGIGMRIRGKQIVSRRVKVMLRAGGMIAGIGRVDDPFWTSFADAPSIFFLLAPMILNA